jgi:hypothetical protein
LADSGAACGAALSGLTTGFIPKAGSASTIINSLADDGITTANTFTYTGTGGISAVKGTFTGSGAGASVYTAGTAQGHATASTVTLEAPASVTAYERVLPGTSATGIPLETNASNVQTESIIAPSTVGTLLYSNGTTWTTLAGNASGTNVLQENASGVPSWAAAGGSSGIPFGAGAGSVNVMTVTTSPAVATNATGTIVMVQPNLANTTTTPTLNVGGAGAQTIVKMGSSGSTIALATGDYGTTAQNEYFTFVSNGTNWILLNPLTAQAGTNIVFNSSGNLECLTGGSCNIGDTNYISNVNAGTIKAGAFNAGGTNSNDTFTGGADTTNTGLTEGYAQFRGGNTTAATGANNAGPALFGGGASTSTSGQQGLAWYVEPYYAGATNTLYNLECESAQMTVADCGASSTSVLGIAASTTNPILVVTNGTMFVNASAAVTLGHTVCTGTTAGKVTDSGGTGACTLGTQVGIVMATSGSYYTPQNTTVTATTTLPLIHMKVD